MLRLASRVYGTVVNRRNRWYDRDPGRTHDVGVPVVSVGNITVGGTGKTPMVAALVQNLCIWSYKPAVLTRGYMPKPGVPSDEAEELRRRFREQHVPVIVNRDRLAGARQAIADGCDALVLDDGFQHRRIARAFDIVLVDALNPFGGDHLLPAGRLREPLSSLTRADAVVITRCNQVDAAVVRAIERRVREHCKALVVRSEVTPTGIVADSAAVRADQQRVLLACGVGNPESVRATVRQLGLNIVHEAIFRDHYVYTSRDMHALMQSARQHKADAVITTVKDWVKLRTLVAEVPAAQDVPLWRVPVQHVFLAGGKELLAAVRAACTRVKRPKPQPVATPVGFVPDES